jgi:hypothetical protein
MQCTVYSTVLYSTVYTVEHTVDYSTVQYCIYCTYCTVLYCAILYYRRVYRVALRVALKRDTFTLSMKCNQSGIPTGFSE